MLRVKRPTSASLVLRMDALRPEEEHITEPDEVVLLAFVEEEPDRFAVSWRVTA